jgi:hypothetical protein
MCWLSERTLQESVRKARRGKPTGSELRGVASSSAVKQADPCCNGPLVTYIIFSEAAVLRAECVMNDAEVFFAVLFRRPVLPMKVGQMRL